jgi:hypothetical protein
MVEQTYGEWDQASADYNPGYTASGAADGVYFDAKSGKYYGIIENRRRTGSSGPLGSKGSKYSAMQRDVYVLDENELDDFRSFFKQYNKTTAKDDYRDSAKRFKRLAYTNETKNYGQSNQKSGSSGVSWEQAFGPQDKKSMGTALGSQSFDQRQYKPDEDFEDEWLKTFMGQQASYLSDTTQGERGQRRKGALLRRDAAREKYQSMMNTGGWGSK